MAHPVKQTPKKQQNLKALNNPKTQKKASLTKAQLMEVYELMVLCRRFEEKAAALYQQGEIGGFLHLYIGQEAVIAGTKFASQPEDEFITSYRCHAHALACGVPPEAIMAELTGRATGASKGKGGSMHLFAPEKHFWGGHGIVAAQTPIGAGLAFAAKYRGEDRVCLNYTGDGAMNAGQTMETLNMAALWELPVLFIIENNRYGMGTSVPRAAAGDLYKRGEPFGIPGEKVDGQDIFAVYEKTRQALNYIRKNQKPYILEMDTYRYRGHSMSDPGRYRPREEVEEMRNARDPITRLHNYLTGDLSLKTDALAAVDKKIKERVNTVAEAALAAPYPALDDLEVDIIPVQ
jgi:pyruvate dehydrogenase E1 component alpha subunit